MNQASYTPLAENVPVGSCICEVWQRLSATQPGWEYQVLVVDGPNRLTINQQEPITEVPHVRALSDMLRSAKLLNEDPPLSYEWAINVDHCNDYPSNFPAEELRDRAIDELFVTGQYMPPPDGSDDVAICAFEILPNGEQVEDGYVNKESWIKTRGLQDLVPEAIKPTQETQR